VTGADVVINSSGRLGVVVSSARFKRDIQEMSTASGALMRLRPVTFHYQDDPAGIRQYGLIAEEVERVYPELVAYGADGKVETVRYSALTPMLLNELQKQARQIETLTIQARLKGAQIDALVERINVLEREARVARPERVAAAMR
jgi:hypothetical protein